MEQRDLVFLLVGAVAMASLVGTILGARAWVQNVVEEASLKRGKARVRKNLPKRRPRSNAMDWTHSRSLVHPNPSASASRLSPIKEETSSSVVKAEEQTQRKVLQRIPNTGNGDCLFLCARLALMTMNKFVSVERLRQTVADFVTDEHFKSLRSIYSTAKEDATDMELIRDYCFMEGVESLEDLKAVVLTPKYWGDEIALQALEDATKLKFIVIQRQENGSFVVARQIDEKAPPSGLYVLLSLDSQHYEVISFGGKVCLNQVDLVEAGVFKAPPVTQASEKEKVDEEIDESKEV